METFQYQRADNTVHRWLQNGTLTSTLTVLCLSYVLLLHMCVWWYPSRLDALQTYVSLHSTERCHRAHARFTCRSETFKRHSGRQLCLIYRPGQPRGKGTCEQTWLADYILNLTSTQLSVAYWFSSVVVTGLYCHVLAGHGTEVVIHNIEFPM